MAVAALIGRCGHKLLRVFPKLWFQYREDFMEILYKALGLFAKCWLANPWRYLRT